MRQLYVLALSLCVGCGQEGADAGSEAPMGTEIPSCDSEVTSLMPECLFSPQAVNIDVQFGGQALVVRYAALELGSSETFYVGPGRDGVGRYVDQIDFCGASSLYTERPCTIELKELTRGSPSTNADGDPIELGSRVHLAVSCPEMLNYPQESDFVRDPLTISPSEFELIAEDCETVGL